MFKSIKTLIGWDTVGTIIKARLEMIGAAITAALTSLAAFNFLPYITGDAINLKAILPVVIYVAGSAVVTEIVRRWNSVDIVVKDMPTEDTPK